MARKIRCEVRVDPAVHAKAKALAEKAGVSLSQLIEGVMWWAVEHGHAGRPLTEEVGLEEFVTNDPEHDQCVWFGSCGIEDDGGGIASFGRVCFELDYAGPRMVDWGDGDES